MKIKFIVVGLSIILVLNAAGCSLLKPASSNLAATQPAAKDSEVTQAAPLQSIPAPTCIPQPIGSCTSPSPDEPVEIIGDIPFTSPFFLNSISEPFVMLEDEAGFVKRDREFRFSLASQTIGPVAVSEDNKLSYTLSLPAVPQATQVDVDQNGKEDLGVQIFAVAYWSNMWGDPFLEARDGKGWSTAYTTAITDPENDDEIVGGILIVWAPDDDQSMSSGFGQDGKLFTEDDPTAPISAGYNLVDLNQEPFKYYKQRQPNLTLNEGAGAVKDYSNMTFGDAFEALFKKISVEYPFTSEKEINWDSLYQDYQPQFERVNTGEQFYSTMRDFIYNIPDGHINISLDQNVFFGNYGGGFGLILDRLSDQRVIAKEVFDKSQAASVGIQQGAEILRWNGEPVNDAIQKVIPGFGPYSTEHTRQQAQVSFLTRVPPNSSVEIEFVNPGGSAQSATLQAVPEYDSLLKTLPSFNLDKLETPIVGNVLDENGLGYIRIDTFSDDYRLMASLWERYMRNMIDNEVPGLIIDIRSNPGGSLGLAIDFASYFFDQEITLYDNFYYSEKSGVFESTGYPTKIKPAPLYFKGPIAVLVSSDCVSACEGFAYALQYDGRSLVVGHYPSAGAFGEVGLGQYSLPGGFTMQFPTGRPQTPEGNVVIEGSGVMPDISVPVSFESALGQTDPVLEAAIQALLEQLQ